MINQVLGMLCTFTKPNIDHRLGERNKRIILDIGRVLVFGDDASKVSCITLEKICVN